MCKRILALLLACCLVAVQTAQAGEISLEEERKIGREALEDVMAHVPLVRDPDIVDYVRQLGRRLAQQVPDSPFPFHFYVADEPDLNAFALPGGWIFIFRGMMASMENEGELAGVMAHEMAHVYYRHLAKRMKRSAPVNVATLAGLLAGIILGSLAGSPQLGQAVAMGSLAGGMAKQLAFSREDEEQADYGAYKIITALKYPPEEMEQSFVRLEQQSRFTGPGNVPPYLLTHPTSPERMEKLQSLIRRYGSPGHHYDNTRFLVMRTRLIALYQPEDTARLSFERRLRRHPGDALALYGLTLLAMRRSQYNRALTLLKRLEEKWHHDNKVLRARGICLVGLGDYQRARPLLEKVLDSRPQDQIALLALARCYRKEGHLEQSRDLLERLLSLNPTSDQALYQMGLTLGKMGRTNQASLYLGLAFMSRRNFRAARYHLQRASEGLAGNPRLHQKALAALARLDEKENKELERRKKEEEEKDSQGRRLGPYAPAPALRPLSVR